MLRKPGYPDAGKKEASGCEIVEVQPLILSFCGTGIGTRLSNCIFMIITFAFCLGRNVFWGCREKQKSYLAGSTLKGLTALPQYVNKGD